MIQSVIELIRNSQSFRIKKFHYDEEERYQVIGDDGSVFDASSNDLAIVFLCVATGNDIMLHPTHDSHPSFERV